MRTQEPNPLDHDLSAAPGARGNEGLHPEPVPFLTAMRFCTGAFGATQCFAALALAATSAFASAGNFAWIFIYGLVPALNIAAAWPARKHISVNAGAAFLNALWVIALGPVLMPGEERSDWGMEIFSVAPQAFACATQCAVLAALFWRRSLRLRPPS
jgi:hypothetical protein